MTNPFIDALRETYTDLTPVDIADILWLALARSEPGALDAYSPEQETTEADATAEAPPAQPPPVRPSADRDADAKSARGAEVNTGADISVGARREPSAPFRPPIRVPGASALPGVRELAGAMRPLRRRVPSRVQRELDVMQTVLRTAEVWAAPELRGRIVLPQIRPVNGLWYELALVIDEGSSMVVWSDAVRELRQMLERHSAFRTVRSWGLATDESVGVAQLYEGAPGERARRVADPRELRDPAGRRLILVVSDCVADAWHNGRVGTLLSELGECPFTIVQVLPERFWQRTALGRGTAVLLQASSPGQANARLTAEYAWGPTRVPDEWLSVPVVTMEATLVSRWVRMMTGAGEATVGVRLPIADPAKSAEDATEAGAQEGAVFEDTRPAAARVQEFRTTVSRIALKLATHFAASPVLSLPIMHLIQETTTPEATQIHLAEVLLSGLLVEVEGTPGDANSFVYDFVSDEVRQLLLDMAPVTISADVFLAITRRIEETFGSPLDFPAYLSDPAAAPDERTRVFARVGADILARMGVRRSTASATAARETTGLPGFVPAEFVICHDPADRRAAEWIAWHFEEQGCAVSLEDWTPDSDLHFIAYNIQNRNHRPVIVVGAAFARHVQEFANILVSSAASGALIQVVPGDRPQRELARYANIAGLDERSTRGEIARLIRETNIPTVPPVLPPRGVLSETQREAVIQSLTRAKDIPVDLARRVVDDPAAPEWADILGGPIDPVATYARALDVVDALTGATSLRLARGEPADMSVVRSIDHHAPGRPYRRVDPSGTMGRAAREQRHVWIRDATLETEYVIVAPETRSELALSLVGPRSGASLGVLNIEWDQPYGASLEQARWLRQWSRRLSAALETPGVQPRLSVAEALDRILLVQGDVLEQVADALVITTSTTLTAVGEVGQQVLKRSPALVETLRSASPRSVGQTFETTTDQVPSRRLIFTPVGPGPREGMTMESLLAGLQAGLRAADRLDGIATVATAAQGGKGMYDATQVATAVLELALEHLQRARTAERVVFAVFDPTLFDVYLSVYRRMRGVQNVRVTGFRPSTSGFHFLPLSVEIQNVLVPTPSAEPLRLMDLRWNMATGMARAAMDYFELNRPLPTDSNTPPPGSLLSDYLLQHVAAALDLGFRGPQPPSVDLELARVLANLSGGNLTLVRLLHSDRPDPTAAYEVVAYGYDRLEDRVIVHVYDPTLPEDDGAALHVVLGDSPNIVLVSSSGAVTSASAFMAVSYAPLEPPLRESELAVAAPELRKVVDTGPDPISHELLLPGVVAGHALLEYNVQPHAPRGVLAIAPSRGGGRILATVAEDLRAWRSPIPPVHVGDGTWHELSFPFDLGEAFGATDALLLVPPGISVRNVRAYAADRLPQTLVVDKSGSGHYTSIGEALLAAKPGAVIQVSPGRYVESLVIDKTVVLVGNGPVSSVVVEGRGDSTVYFRADGGRIANLMLVQAARDGWFGLDVTRGSPTVERCTISSLAKSAVVIHDGATPDLRNNTISQAAEAGVFYWGGGGGTLVDNVIQNNGSSGVEITAGSRPIVRRNVITANRDNGVWVHDRGEAVLEANDLRGNGLRALEIEPASLSNVALKDNLLEDSVNLEPDPVASVIASTDGLQAICLELHMMRLRPPSVDRDPAERAFGRGNLLSDDQFQRVRGYCEWAVRASIDDLVDPRWRYDRDRLLPDLAGVPALSAVAAALVDRVLTIAPSISAADAMTVTATVERDVSQTLQFQQAISALSAAGARVQMDVAEEEPERLVIRVSGPASARVRALSAVAGALMPQLPLIEVDRVTSDRPKAEARVVVALTLLFSSLAMDLLTPSASQSGSKSQQVAVNRDELWRVYQELPRWIQNAVDPRWRQFRDGLATTGVRGFDRELDFTAFIRQFLALIDDLLRSGLSNLGDFRVEMGYGIGREHWELLTRDPAIARFDLVAEPSTLGNGDVVLLRAQLSVLVRLFERLSQKLMTALNALNG